MKAGGNSGGKAASQRRCSHQHHAWAAAADIVLNAGCICVCPEVAQCRVVVYGNFRNAIMPKLLGACAYAIAHQHRPHLEARHGPGQCARLSDQFQTHRMQAVAAELGKHEDIVPAAFVHGNRLGFQPHDGLLRTALDADAAYLAGGIELGPLLRHINGAKWTIALTQAASCTFAL